MAKTNKNDQLAQDDPRESAATNNQQSQTPPTELEEIVRHKVKIRDSDKEREMSLLAANFFAHAVKGAKGDSRL
jgi:hypothetical protein